MSTGGTPGALDELANLEGGLWGSSITRLAASRTPRKEKVRIWLDSLCAAGTERALARLVARKAPGYEDFLNLSSDRFRSINHPKAQPPRRSVFVTMPESFLRGEVSTPLSAGAFLMLMRDRRNYLYFLVREIACAHCQSAERFAYVLKNLRPKIGKADFVDALGYSPFFYAAFTRTLNGEEAFSQRLVGGEGETICRLIRKAGAHPGCQCRHGFSWKDLETVAHETAAASGGAGTTRSGNAEKAPPCRPPVPAPSLGDIRRMLVDDPDRAVAALVAMGYEPRPLEHSFGPRERFLSDAIYDRGIPRSTRARLLQLCDHAETLACLPLEEAKGKIPTGFLDTVSARHWTCKHNLPGCAFVRCSDAILFKRVLSLYEPGIPCAWMAKLARRGTCSTLPSAHAVALRREKRVISGDVRRRPCRSMAKRMPGASREACPVIKGGRPEL